MIHIFFTTYTAPRPPPHPYPWIFIRIFCCANPKKNTQTRQKTPKVSPNHHHFPHVTFLFGTCQALKESKPVVLRDHQSSKMVESRVGRHGKKTAASFVFHPSFKGGTEKSTTVGQKCVVNRYYCLPLLLLLYYTYIPCMYMYTTCICVQISQCWETGSIKLNFQHQFCLHSIFAFRIKPGQVAPDNTQTHQLPAN